jgi:hypothetical protein
MRIIRAAFLPLIALLTTSSSVFGQSAVPPDSWSLLRRITHDRTYVIQTRDLKCHVQKITKLTDDGLTVTDFQRYSTTEGMEVPRSEVLRVSGGESIYYSGRSSWQDVHDVTVKWRDSLRFIEKDGTVHHVRAPFVVSGDAIEFQKSGKSVRIEKSHIAKVFFVAMKPRTAAEDYALDELGPMIVFDPDAWQYWLRLEPYVPVLLYDATKPEDNSPLKCTYRW